MSIELLWAWAVVSFIGLVLPGPDFFFITSLSFKRRRHGIIAGLGIQIGAAIWMFLTIIGLSAILKVYPLAYQILEFVGSCYLIYMASRIILTAIAEFKQYHHLNKRQEAALEHQLEEQFHQFEKSPEVSNLTEWQCITRGITANLLNAKCGLYFITVLPQFIKSDQNIWPQFWALTAIEFFLGLIYWAILATLVNSLVKKFSKPSFRVSLELVSGVIFLGIALTLFASAVSGIYGYFTTLQ